jgi:tetratricopeptide (TPR) repeat protein
MTDSDLPRRIFTILQQGNAGEAERLARDALARSPDDQAMLFLRAMSLQQQERHDEAAIDYARLTELSPDVAAYWTNRATALRLAGRSAEALADAAKAVSLAPDEGVHWTVLGLAQLQAGDHAAAQASLLKACALDPTSAEAHIHAANALVMVRDAQAYTLLKGWQAWLPLDPPEQLLLAHLLMTIGDARDAHDVLLELLQRHPMHVKGRLQLAALDERMNELDRSEALLADTLGRNPSLDEGSRLEVAHLRATLAARRGNHADARTILEAAGPRTPLDYAHWFLLADVQDKLGDAQAAMQSLAVAHARQVEDLTPLAPECFARGATIMPNAAKRISPEEYARWPVLTAPVAQQSPVFIVGFPRSGTTLLEQMLDAHPGLQSMDERPFFTILANELAGHGVSVPKELYRLDQRDCDELRKRYLGLVTDKIRRRWDARLVDKNPLNMLALPLILRLYPKGKIILALRHPCDVVLSNYMQNYRSCTLASACSTLERTARAYVATFEAFLRDVDLLKPDLLVSRYEELVDDPTRQAQRYADFLGLDDSSPMLRYDQHAREKGFIATPSYTEVIQPVSRRRMDRWRRYQREFEPILPILEPMLRHWGYTVEPM